MGPNTNTIPIHLPVPPESDSWFSRRSIAAKLSAIVLVFVCIIMALLAVVSLNSALNTGVRAFVGAEGLWSKGQKDAVYYLTRYAHSREEQDYRKYLSAVAIPLAHHAARLEMGKPSYDYGAAERGFAQGGNSAADVPCMIFVFRHFHDAPHFAEAIRIWTEADVHIARLTQAADELHAAVGSGALTSERANALLNRIEDINGRLTPLERDFSAAMGEGSRWVRRVTLTMIFSTAALLLAVGLWVSWRIAQDLRSGILSLREGALRVAHGHLDQPIAIKNHDELGELAIVFNDMILHRRDVEAARKQAEAALQESEQSARRILDAAHDAFVAMNSAGEIIDWNAQAERLFGWSRQEAVGRNLADTIIPPESREAHSRGLQHFLATGEGPVLNKTIEIAALHREGREIPIELSIQAVTLRKGYAFNAFIRDITERKEAEKRLLDLAHFDPLTGLPNRRHYHESLERALLRARANSLLVSVLFIDLDRFKNVNDSLGHALGDDLLRKASARMTQCLRAGDILGRLGGDEFAIILIDPSDPQEPAIVANTIINELHRPFDLDGHDVTVTASIGITTFPNDASDASTLMKYADTAMYEAKSAGRDTYRFHTAAMNARAQLKHNQENALRRAIDHDEYVLHYQPIMQIDTGQWAGAEALLRWNRPGHGLILPGEFIPTLEETGLIIPVGAWVIDAACKQIAEWERSGIGSVAVAVNVSARQFMMTDVPQEDGAAIWDGGSFKLLDFVRGAEIALSKHRIAASLLEFELTESTLMSGAETTVGILQQLKSLGIRISIDDFGTGYSSLAYLRRFSIDTLKIDQAFIRDVTSNADDASIVMAIISMAHSLKLKVIAEGVETQEQLDFLRIHGCDQAQGYLLARPMPATELADLFRARNRLSTSKDVLRLQ